MKLKKKNISIYFLNEFTVDHLYSSDRWSKWIKIIMKGGKKAVSSFQGGGEIKWRTLRIVEK